MTSTRTRADRVWIYRRETAMARPLSSQIPVTNRPMTVLHRVQACKPRDGRDAAHRADPSAAPAICPYA